MKAITSQFSTIMMVLCLAHNMKCVWSFSLHVHVLVIVIFVWRLWFLWLLSRKEWKISSERGKSANKIMCDVDGKNNKKRLIEAERKLRSEKTCKLWQFFGEVNTFRWSEKIDEIFIFFSSLLLHFFDFKKFLFVGEVETKYLLGFIPLRSIVNVRSFGRSLECRTQQILALYGQKPYSFNFLLFFN